MGGKVFDFVEPISKENVAPTISVFFETVLSLINPNLTDDDIKLLGSQGKKSKNNDLDVGINIYKFINSDSFEFDDVKREQKKLMEEIKMIILGNNDLSNLYTSYNIDIDEILKYLNFGSISLAFPQFDKNYIFIEGKFVQIDLFLGDLNWLEQFQMSGYLEDFQEDERLITKYKGQYRNMLLQSILRVFPIKEYEDEKYYYVEKYTEDFTGLYIIKRKRLKDKPNSSLRTIERQRINIDFLDFWKKFFDDPDLSFEDIQTFENLLDYIKQNPKTKDKLDEIFKHFSEMCEK